MAATAEQQQKLDDVLAVVGTMACLEVVRAVLESADWNVEVALNGLLETCPPAEVPATQQTADRGSQYAQMPSPSVSTGTEWQPDLAELEPTGPVCPTCDLGHPLAYNPMSTHFCDVGGPDCKRNGTTFRCASGCDFDACDVCCSEERLTRWEDQLATLHHKFPAVSRSQLTAAWRKHGGSLDLVGSELQEMERAHAERIRLNAERRAQIAVQDAEFHESLLLDQQREAVRKETEESERKLQEANARSAHEAEVALQAKRERVSQPEPDQAHPDRCQIVIRTPSGKRLSRIFLSSDAVSFVYDWIDVVCAEKTISEDSYQLVSRLPGMPSKELHKCLRTLKEEGVVHQTVFYICVD